MQSRRFPLRGAALVAVLALLLATPALAAPMGTMGTGDASWLGFEAIWHRLAGAFGVWIGADGQGVVSDGFTAAGSTGQADAPSSIDRVIGSNGHDYDPDGSPASTSPPSAAPPVGSAAGLGGTDPNR